MGNFLENTVSGIGDAVGRVGEGLGNAFKGLTGGSGTSNKSEGQMDEIRKKIMQQAAVQRGETPVMKKGGKVSNASSRADGIAQRGKTRGTMVMCGGGMARGKK